MRKAGGALISSVDDTYIITPPEVAFRCLHNHVARVTKIGLSLQLTKTKCYIHKDHRAPEYNEFRGAIKEGFVQQEGERKAYGLKIYGIPIGDKRYVKITLKSEATRISNHIIEITKRMNPQQIIAP